MHSIIEAAVRIARRAGETSRGMQEKFVALDVGPLGKLMEPFGSLSFEDAVSAFSDAIRFGAESGADLIFVETMNDATETKAALLAAKESCELPVFVSNTYGENGRLMTGAGPEVMVPMLESLGADAIGINCSLGPDAMTPVAEQYLQLASVPVLFKPNAGLPTVTNGITSYRINEETFARSVLPVLEKGVRLAGGCCGTDPHYLSALSDMCADLHPPKEYSEKKRFLTSRTCSVSLLEGPVETAVLSGKENETVRAALISGSAEDLAEEAEEMSGSARVLCLDAGDTSAEMIRTILPELQAQIRVPMILCTELRDAAEIWLRNYTGASAVACTSAKSAELLLPAARKYGSPLILVGGDSGNRNSVLIDINGKSKKSPLFFR